MATLTRPSFYVTEPEVKHSHYCRPLELKPAKQNPPLHWFHGNHVAKQMLSFHLNDQVCQDTRLSCLNSEAVGWTKASKVTKLINIDTSVLIAHRTQSLIMMTKI